MINKIKDYIPLLTSLLIIGNIIQLNFYYSNFHIDIFNYLDFTELTLGFLDDLFYLLLFIGFICIDGILSDLLNTEASKKNKMTKRK